MESNNLSIYDEDYLKSKIYIIRGIQVMLDADLAEIYGYTTKRFNEQVKNNIERFDEEMRFQITNSEYDILRSKISTSKPKKRGGRQYLPYVFTEQGIYMLMTVLKGDLAVDHRVSSITKVEDVMLYQNIIGTLHSKLFKNYYTLYKNKCYLCSLSKK